MKFAISLLVTAAATVAAPLAAQQSPLRPNFHSGSVITGFGPIANVEGAEALSKDAQFSVAFDVAAAANPGELNRTFECAARFINMHVEAGVPAENIKLAVVVHGGAAFDVTNAARYAAKNPDTINANAPLIAELQKHRVEFYLCGQSAAAHNVIKSDLLPGVKLPLSAMTAHALLQQKGYTLNPF